MSETRGSRDGGLTVDAALSEWPDVEKPEGDWDDRARSVMDRLRRGERGATAGYVSDESLLSAPLGQSSEDGHNTASPGGSVNHPPIREGKPMTMPVDRERDRRSLQDLAKMAQGLTPPPASSVGSVPSGVHRAADSVRDRKDDSGIIDLAAASQSDPQAATRAQTTPLASQGLFDEEPHTQRAAVSAPLAQPVPSIPPISSAPASLATPASAASPAAAPAVGAFVAQPIPAALEKKEKKGGVLIALVVGGVVALSAAAAGGILFMKNAKTSEATATSPAAKAPPVVVAEATPPTTAAAPATPAPAEPTPEATPDTPAPHSKIALAPKGFKGAAKAAAPAAAPAPAKADGPAKMTEKDLVAAPSGAAGDLGAAIKKEVGGDDGAPKTPAAATTGGAAMGNVPQKPSQGAVTGAVGAVLPQARACLGPDDPISRATIVFGSNGAVQSVNVGGSAAGKPAEACIKGALTKAKLQPFAESTYTANITIRHN